MATPKFIKKKVRLETQSNESPEKSAATLENTEDKAVAVMVEEEIEAKKSQLKYTNSDLYT